MEAKELAQTESPATPDAACSECLAPASAALSDREGAPLCRQCADEFYAACAGCGGLVPRDDMTERDGLSYCADCYGKTGAAAAESLPDEEVKSLVNEYLKLYREEKRIGQRLSEIKDLLKSAAATRQRTAGAVILQSDEGVIRCRYSVRLKCDEEKVAALEQVLGPDRFASLFERKVSFAPVKKGLEEFLSGHEATDAEAREAVRAAVEEVEVPALSVPPRKQ